MARKPFNCHYTILKHIFPRYAYANGKERTQHGDFNMSGIIALIIRYHWLPSVNIVHCATLTRNTYLT